MFTATTNIGKFKFVAILKMAHVHLSWFVYIYTVGLQDLAYSIVRVNFFFFFKLVYDDHTVSNTLQRKRQSMATSDEELGGARLRMPCLQIPVS